MSGAMENRAAVFANSSQDVEVYQSGAWWPGSLLGWRHETDGSCHVWVRALVAGVERTSWIDLVEVRLPERPALQSVATAPGLTGEDAGRDALTSTISLFAVRDDGNDGAAAADAGRAGGRRRAPERQDVPAWAAATGSETATAATRVSAGRHRAPASLDAGRHRAADTGALPAIPAEDDAPARRRPAAPPPGRERRVEDRWPSTEVSGRALPVLPEPAGAPNDGEFYTRPLRLATSVPQPRSSHWDD